MHALRAVSRWLLGVVVFVAGLHKHAHAVKTTVAGSLTLHKQLVRFGSVRLRRYVEGGCSEGFKSIFSRGKARFLAVQTVEREHSVTKESS